MYNSFVYQKFGKKFTYKRRKGENYILEYSKLYLKERILKDKRDFSLLIYDFKKDSDYLEQFYRLDIHY